MFGDILRKLSPLPRFVSWRNLYEWDLHTCQKANDVPACQHTCCAVRLRFEFDSEFSSSIVCWGMEAKGLSVSSTRIKLVLRRKNARLYSFHSSMVPIPVPSRRPKLLPIVYVVGRGALEDHIIDGGASAKPASSILATAGEFSRRRCRKGPPYLGQPNGLPRFGCTSVSYLPGLKGSVSASDGVSLARTRRRALDCRVRGRIGRDGLIEEE